jgi:hypothetical protein
MQRPEEMANSPMRRLADEIEAYMREHELEVHGGEPCIRNRESAVGFIAHCLGVRSVPKIAEMIALYDLHCPNCSHMRN